MTTALELLGLIALVVGVLLTFGVGPSLIAAGVACFAASWALTRNAEPKPLADGV